jgi:U4/U6.U5 tri-snRNP component SNU23
MAQPGSHVNSVDNTYRRKWDREEYLERARERADEEDGRLKPKAKVPPVQRKPLKHRDYEVDLESRLGKTQVVTPVAPLSQQAGYYCSVCECVVKDSANYLDHINGKKTSKGTGNVNASGKGIIGTGTTAV